MITFKKIRWKNFLSTGNQFIEVDLTKNKTNLIVGKNGAGKSTILDALTFSLFGKPYRKINKPKLVNSINEKDCVAETEFSIGKNDYKIVRGIKPAKFEIYCNNQLWNQESSALDQQKQLEQNILKMNYKSFTQIVVLGSSNFIPFMRLPLASRREIIEDILDIQIFSTMNVNLKEKVKFVTEEMRDRDYQIDTLDQKIEMQKSFIDDLQKKTEDLVVSKENKITELSAEQTIQSNNIEEFTKEINHLSNEVSAYAGAAEKLKKLNTFKGKIQQKYSTHEKEHKFFTENESCPTCGQSIDEHVKDDRLSSIMSAIKELNKGFEEIESAISQEEERNKTFTELTTSINDYSSKISFANTTISRIQRQIDETQQEVQSLTQTKGKETEAYSKLEEYESALSDAREQLVHVKQERECLQAAGMLLKDNGIKTRIIKRYLPVMNKLINEYLSNMDFYVNFTLNENFEETIKSRHRDVFSYESFSEGEKSRIDIALLLTWRAVAKLKSSVDTNLLILDEIFDGSLDTEGSSDLGWILRNFDKSTNVFVISHKESMDDKFHATWKCEKVKNFSVMKETVNELGEEG